VLHSVSAGVYKYGQPNDSHNLTSDVNESFFSRPRPKLYFLSSRCLKTKTLVLRTTSEHLPHQVTETKNTNQDENTDFTATQRPVLNITTVTTMNA